MQTYLVTIKDTLSGVHHQPTSVLNLAHAERAFGQQCRDKSDPRNEVARAPGDYELWVIGEYDDATGEVTQYGKGKKRRLATGKTYITA